jgi:hypothetical protein
MRASTYCTSRKAQSSSRRPILPKINSIYSARSSSQEMLPISARRLVPPERIRMKSPLLSRTHSPNLLLTYSLCRHQSKFHQRDVMFGLVDSAQLSDFGKVALISGPYYSGLLWRNGIWFYACGWVALIWNKLACVIER